MIRFSLIGPLRTGSSLLSRCLDDHPSLVCLCESEINRALYGNFDLKLHFLRMRKHGLSPIEVVSMLDQLPQRDEAAYERWFRRLTPILSERYHLREVAGIGDKSPDFFRTPNLASQIMNQHRLIYTVRDPRAVFRSIHADKTSQVAKDRRWEAFFENFRFWKSALTQENLLVVKYENLVKRPEQELRKTFQHIGVEYSAAYSKPFPRHFPERFLWDAVTENAHQGISFNASKCDQWRDEINEDALHELMKQTEFLEVLEYFGYPSE